MKEILQFYANKLSAESLSLKKKTLLVDKPWAYIDENGVLMKLIFRSNHTVIIAQNGKVTEGEWEYISATKNLLFGNGQDKYLLKEMFIDPNVLVMKKDGMENDFIALANEDMIPDYNILSYLRKLNIRRNEIKPLKAKNGYILDVYQKTRFVNILGLIGLPVVVCSDDSVNAPISIEEERFEIELDGKELCTYIKNNTVHSIHRLISKTDINGKKYVIEVEYEYPDIKNGCIIRDSSTGLNADGSIITTENNIYHISDGVISSIGNLETHQLEEGYKIQVEYITSVDSDEDHLIRQVEPDGIIPDGIYRDNDKFRKYYIVNGWCVSKRKYRDHKRESKRNRNN